LAYNRRDGRKTDSKPSWEVESVYSEEQIEAVIEECGERVNDYEESHFRLYCPFHGNTNSPTLVIDRESGLFHCFNPACGTSGTLIEFVMRLTKGTPFAAARLIAKHKTATGLTLDERLARELAVEEEWVPFPVETLARCYDEFWQTPAAIEYMHGRHFEDETLEYFRIGYSARRDTIMVPMHSPDGLPVGVIGRSIKGKDFKNSKELPKKKVPWNYHRAKREGDTVIICEASFDAMRIHQAGYRNVVALLGGSLSPQCQRLLARTFNNIVIMTDNDDPTKHVYPGCLICKKAGSLCKGHNPGEDLGLSIANKMRDKRVLWAHCGEATRFPKGIKDAGDMTDQMIRHCISNAISSLEYMLD
jgi:DNA primase